LVKVVPDELYHLAGQSHVGLSFEIRNLRANDRPGHLRLLEMVGTYPAASAFPCIVERDFRSTRAGSQDERPAPSSLAVPKRSRLRWLRFIARRFVCLSATG
jgi:hypothetical protein